MSMFFLFVMGMCVLKASENLQGLKWQKTITCCECIHKLIWHLNAQKIHERAHFIYEPRTKAYVNANLSLKLTSMHKG